MAEPNAVKSSTPDYTMGYSEEYMQFLTEHRAREAMVPLVPRLSDGMRILDLGCGPGLTTIVLAEAVSHGEVWGIDIEPGQVESARANALRAGCANVRFEVSDALSLPCDDESCDVVALCDVLAYVPDPAKLIAEATRVLKRGGILFAREMIIESSFAEPETAAMRRGWETFADLLRADDGDPQMGRRVGQLLSAAGLETERVSMVMESYTEPAELESFYRLVDGWFLSPEIVAAIERYGVGLASDLQQLKVDMVEWRRAPGALGAIAFGQAIATKP